MLKLFTRLLAVLALLLLVLPAALLGLLSSEAGTSLIASQLQQKLGANLQWQQLNGSLTGPLHISGLEYTQPGLSARIDSLELDWDPSALLAGRLQLAELQLDGLTLNITGGSDNDTASTPFNPADIPLPLDIEITDAHLTKVQLIQGDEPLHIDSIRLKARLANRELAVETLSLALAGATAEISGSLLLDTNMPLDILTDWTWQQGKSAPLTGEARIDGAIDWDQGMELALEYSVRAAGLSALQADLPNALELRGELAGQYQENALSLGLLTLEQADSDLALEITGRLSELDSDKPQLDHRVQWRALRWPLEADNALVESAEGELNIKGPLDAYQLELALALSGTDIPDGDWSLTGRGDLSSLQLQQLTGNLLSGAINASGRLAWAPAPSWDLQVTAQDINPEPLVQQLPGSVSARLATRGELAPDQQLLAQLELQQLGGELAGYPLAVNGDASIAGDQLEFNRLELNSGRNQLQASGSVNADTLEIDWRLRALAPGELLAGANGSLSGKGTVSGSPQAPKITGQLRGEELQLDTLQSSALAVEFAAGTQPGDRLLLNITTGPVTDQDSSLLQSMRLEATGTNAQHMLKAALDRGNEQLSLAAEGGLSPQMDSWGGSLNTLRLNTVQWGQWLQQQATPLELAADSASLGNFCLAQVDGAGNLCLQGNWSALADSKLALAANALPLSLIQPAIGGDVSAQFDGSMAGNGSLAA